MFRFQCYPPCLATNTRQTVCLYQSNWMVLCRLNLWRGLACVTWGRRGRLFQPFVVGCVCQDILVTGLVNRSPKLGCCLPSLIVHFTVVTCTPTGDQSYQGVRVNCCSFIYRPAHGCPTSLRLSTSPLLFFFSPLHKMAGVAKYFLELMSLGTCEMV